MKIDISSATRPIGGFYPADNEGYVINTASWSNLSVAQQVVLQLCYDWVSKAIGDDLHSLWARGSLVRGEYQEGLSDLDLFILRHDPAIGRWQPVPEAQQLALLLQAQYGIHELELMQSGLATDGRPDPKIAMQLATASLLIGGAQLVHPLPRYRPAELLLNYRWIATDLSDFAAGQLAVGPFCKAFLRTLQEVTVTRSGRYTPDLFYCCTEFSRYYPAAAADAWQILWHYLHPTAHRAALLSCAYRLWPLLHREIKQWIETDTDPVTAALINKL